MAVCRTETFGGNEDGAFSLLMLVLFLGIIGMTGIALDLAKQESERAELQSALDRGVLAAASLTQTLDAETVVNEYLDNRVLRPGKVNVKVSDETYVNSHRVSAKADYGMDTTFMRLAGVDTLDVVGAATAVHAKRNIEISMVLDVSSSMTWADSGGKIRIERLKDATAAFIDTVTDEGQNEDVSISIVPFNTEVNVSDAMFDAMNARRDVSPWTGTRVTWHNCVAFTDDRSEFPPNKPSPNDARLGMPRGGPYYTVPTPQGPGGDNYGWCPDTKVRPFLGIDSNAGPGVNGAEAIRAVATDLRASGRTSTYYGMKYGLALLSPTVRGIVEAESNADSTTVPARFKGRPADWDDDETLKVIVLMTDGKMNETSYSDYLPWWNPGYRKSMNRLRSMYRRTCNAAKHLGVVIFTVSFEPNTQGEINDMKNCASSDSHHFNARGIDIVSAFNTIAATIKNLKLVQG